MLAVGDNRMNKKYQSDYVEENRQPDAVVPGNDLMDYDGYSSSDLSEDICRDYECFSDEDDKLSS